MRNGWLAADDRGDVAAKYLYHFLIGKRHIFATHINMLSLRADAPGELHVTGKFDLAMSAFIHLHGMDDDLVRSE